MSPECGARPRGGLRSAVRVLFVVVTAITFGCELDGGEFGKTCSADAPCDEPYVCFEGACVPPDYPLLDGEGEGEGEGE